MIAHFVLGCILDISKYVNLKGILESQEKFQGLQPP